MNEAVRPFILQVYLVLICIVHAIIIISLAIPIIIPTGVIKLNVLMCCNNMLR